MRAAALAAFAALILLVPGAGAQVFEASPGSPPTSAPAGESPGSSAGAALGVPALSGRVDANRYRVGPGDLFRLEVSGPLSRTTLVRVGPEGEVVLPGAGSIQISGLTLAEARLQVLARLRSEYREVRVDWRLERPRRFRVSLTGRVRQPGEVEVAAIARLSDILTPAQMLEDASQRSIELRRRDGRPVRADLGLFLTTGDAAALPDLEDGDVIHVPVAREFMHVFGAVGTPGRFERVVGDSLTTLLRIAGGLVPAANPGPMLLLRWSGAATPDSQWIDRDDRAAQAAPMQDGDRLYVFFQPQYRLQHEVAMLGEIARPGQYPITEGVTRLSDVVRQAGGFLPTADLSSIRIRRATGIAGERDTELERLLRLSRTDLTLSEYEALRTKLAAQREDYRVNWGQLQRTPALDLPLRHGDLVRVERLVQSVRVDGEVRTPAIVAHRPGLRVADTIREAGGYTDRAWTAKVRVTRAVTGQTLLARSVGTLEPGDFVWVPEKQDDSLWQRSQQLLTALAQVATVVIAIRSVR